MLMKYKNIRVAYSIENILYIDTFKNTTDKTVINLIAEKHNKARVMINIIGIEEIK